MGDTQEPTFKIIFKGNLEFKTIIKKIIEIIPGEKDRKKVEFVRKLLSP